MHIVFVHGWSVRHTDTYGGLPAALRRLIDDGTLKATVTDLHLGKYVSFEDTVTLDDISKAFDAALRAHPTLKAVISAREPLACITHSTGGPVIRNWVQLFYAKKNKLKQCPLTHLIMLAPANHGSALAQLGKSRLSRMKFFLEGAEPGARVLDWLELGSPESWALNQAWLTLDPVATELYPFVLTGQTIDRSMYDTINAYTGEAGSDGVVRVAAANLNYTALELVQDPATGQLVADDLRVTPRTALAVLPGLSHSGDEMGIIKSVPPDPTSQHETLLAVRRCLAVKSAADYRKCVTEFETKTTQTQKDEESRPEKRSFLFSGGRVFKTPRCAMVIFRFTDDAGEMLNDYELRLTAGKDYSEHKLPPGFFIDRQRNSRDGSLLTYFFNHDVLATGLEKKLDDRFGFRLIARPDQGFARYMPAEFRGTAKDIGKALVANQTTLITVRLHRIIDRGVFTLREQSLGVDPIDTLPTGRDIAG
ncbi:MAG TPA: hypothetical protein VF777_11715 [Phycisphaerales bacterium]